MFRAASSLTHVCRQSTLGRAWALGECSWTVGCSPHLADARSQRRFSTLGMCMGGPLPDTTTTPSSTLCVPGAFGCWHLVTRRAQAEAATQILLALSSRRWVVFALRWSALTWALMPTAMWARIDTRVSSVGWWMRLPAITMLRRRGTRLAACWIPEPREPQEYVDVHEDVRRPPLDHFSKRAGVCGSAIASPQCAGRRCVRRCTEC